jgi:hypothetical protein
MPETYEYETALSPFEGERARVRGPLRTRFRKGFVRAAPPPHPSPLPRFAGAREPLVFLCAATFIVVLELSSATMAYASRKIEHCRRMLTQKAYEAAGSRLVATKSADLEDLPKNLICCGGAAGLGAFVADDGSVGLTDVEHTAWADWRVDYLRERLAAMRFEPPRVMGNPVCVRYDVNWRSDNPHMFERWDR